MGRFSTWILLIFLFFCSNLHIANGMLKRTPFSSLVMLNNARSSGTSVVLTPQITLTQSIDEPNCFPAETWKHRLPSAIAKSVSASAKVFTQNCKFLIPIGIVTTLFNKPESTLQGIQDGCKWGMQMASMGAIYSGSEEFMKRARNVDDVYNKMFASGLYSGVFRMQSRGFLGFAEGALTGASFAVILERLRHAMDNGGGRGPFNGNNGHSIFVDKDMKG